MYSPMKKADLASRLPVEPILHHGQPQRILPKQAFAKQYLLYGMAVVVFVIGLGASIQGWLANQAVTTQASVLSQHTTRGGDAEQPSEDPPQSTGGYSVAPELPRMISIPSIQVNARILHLGVDDKNVLKSPNNIFDTAWYQSSARPTDTKGAMLIDGHVSGPTKHGVFYDIKKLKKGDDIVVERGDGQKIHFEVVEVMTTLAEEVNMSALLRSIDESKLGLNLITCGGTFNAETNTFESRTQVFAVKKSL
jgi:LPXTG-site transpeptidase (sortase) family protein